MDFLKHTEDPKFRGLVVRRLTPQINGPGGVLETFENLHRKVYGDKLKVRRRDGVFQYPSGATISFRHMQFESDRHNYQGWQLSAILIDEAQQLEESMVVYLMSRLRSEAKMKSKMRMTCNPAGKGHWLTNWLEWYLLPSGLPDPEKSGKLRWFTMKDNEMIWGMSKEEILEKVPGSQPLTFAFISANVYDNPILMKRQPEYVSWLEGLDRESKEALLYGNWYVTKQEENYFKRQWVPVVPDKPFFGRRMRGFDLAGTVPDEVNKDPDYTATVLLSKTGDKYCIEHAHRLRDHFHNIEKYMLDLSKEDPDDITYVIPVDAGAAGKAYARSLQQKLAESGRHCVLFPSSNKSKLTRFRPFASVCQAGAVEAVSAQWNDWFFTELEQFSDDGKKHDDALDAVVAAFWALNQGVQLPNIVIATDLTSSLQNFKVQQQFTSLPFQGSRGPEIPKVF